MDEREKRVLQVLRDALDTSPSDRDQFVSDRCGGDTVLRERVAALLRGIGESEADLADAHGIDDAFGETRASDDVMVGTMLGSFRVAERIGRGGMGVVYRGVRIHADFEQEVAIKLIRHGFDFDDVHARFVRERRILARMSHPNLARFIDGGVSDERRPWFALEFVRGASIVRWCDERNVDVRARVTLFLDVCAAVQYAHTQLVVHRDLKPGNVLVDASGIVRLLDFGVAGLLSGTEDTGEKVPTIAARRALTPEYAAPEQFGVEGAGVAADVYALGVILYELLSGVLPYEIDRNDLAAAERTVRETPPQALALAITRKAAPEDIEKRLAARNETRSSFRRSVRGDLSRIVEVALAKEISRRYATVEAFAGDLARWLAGSPVQVSGNSVGYRLGKFARRNRIAVALGAAALALILALSIFHVVSLSAQLKQTQAQRERAQASLGFMQQLLSSPDPQTEFGPQTNLGDVLIQASATIGASTHVDPDVRDEIGITIAASLRGIERYDDALALLNGIANSSSPTTDAKRNRVAALAEIGQIETLKGNYDQALRTLEHASALADESRVTDPLVIANLLSAESVAHNHLAQWDESSRLIDRAIEIAEPIREQEPAFYANLLGFASIPRAYPHTDLRAAETFLRRSLAFQETHGLVRSGLYPNTKGELAQALIDQGRFEDAEPMLLDVVTQMKMRYGENNRETSFKLSNLALLYLRWNRMEEARRWRDDATRSMKAALGDKHPFVALDLIQSADVAFYAGDAERAAREAREGAEIADAQDGPEFIAKAELYDAHARCLRGDPASLLPLRQRLTELKDSFGVRAFDVRLAAANCFVRQRAYDEAVAAIEPFEKALASGKTISRNDYLRPEIERIKTSARGSAP
jgi:serine/threonine-protein kinase